MSLRSKLTWALGFLAIAGCGDKRPVAHTASGPAVDRKSSAADKEALAITVYNQNFGLVREVRKVRLAKGRVALEYKDVSAHIQPETVHIKSLEGENALAVLEQNYRYDVLSPEKLLEKHVGKSIRVYRYNETTGQEQSFDAEVLAVDKGVVLKINGEVTYNFKGRFAFPEVPENLLAKPTLVWLLASNAPNQRVEVSYLTRRLNWAADYVLVVDSDDKKADLTGWVTLENRSGTSYENAQLKLVAGDVQRVTPEAPEESGYAEAEAMDRSQQRENFKQESFFEYHLYSLQRPTSLLDKEKKQVTLLEAQGIGIKKKLSFFGQRHYYRSRYGKVATNQKVGVYLEIKNEKKNGLGMPLPKGIVRVYKADSSGAKQFIGEDRIDHTPRDEELTIKMGEAFDVVGDRKQMSWRSLGRCSSESDWEVELRNHKDEAVEVEVVEPIGGDWTIEQASHSHKKEDAKTFIFEVNVPARGKTKITYRVRIRWC